MPPKKSATSSTSASTKKVTSSSSSSSKMKTTATARKTASRSRAAPAPLRSGGAAPKKQASKGTTARKPAVVPSNRRRTVPVIPKKRFARPPPPPMYWICYDFTIKLVRGMCLGIVIGLVLTVVVPWILDTGYFFYDKVSEADLAIPKNLLPDFNYSLPSWNETSKRLWRVDQGSQQSDTQRGFLRAAKTTPAPTVDPIVAADQKLVETFPRNMNRTIMVVHAGHTGGTSLMDLCPQVYCQQQFSKDPTKLQACIQDRVTPIATPVSPLARQAQYYFHMGSVQDIHVSQSTSFLYTLRNPVDRLLAIFADSHPLACTDQVQQQMMMNTAGPWGCQNKQYWNMPDTIQYSFYTKCFPTPDPESFAQAAMGPWPNMTTAEQKLVETAEQQKHNCHWLAREMAAGQIDQIIPLAPHAYYNYEFYAQNTLYGHQEILGIRSEHPEDLMALDKLMGRGNATMGSNTVNNEAPPRTPSVSREAYGKLCCVLMKEINVYRDILSKVANLPDYKKDEAVDDLRKKCGIIHNTESSWSNWRSNCQSQLDLDGLLLTPEEDGFV